MFTVTLDAPEIETALEQEIEAEIENLTELAAREIPGGMQQVMMESAPAGVPFAGGRRSAAGQPPAIVTRTLLTSIHGEAIGKDTVEITMAEHAQFLDPNFDEGYLNRPFIDAGIDKALERI